MNRILRALAFAGIAAALVAGPVGVSLADDAAVKARQADMKAMGKASAAVKNFVEKGQGTAADVAKAANQIAMIADRLPKMFPKGTGEMDAAAGKNRAKADIWMKWAAFEKSASGLKSSATMLADAAGAGDAARIKTAFAAVGKSCGSCHKPFRGAKK